MARRAEILKGSEQMLVSGFRFIEAALITAIGLYFAFEGGYDAYTVAEEHGGFIATAEMPGFSPFDTSLAELVGGIYVAGTTLGWMVNQRQSFASGYRTTRGMPTRRSSDR